MPIDIIESLLPINQDKISLALKINISKSDHVSHASVEISIERYFQASYHPIIFQFFHVIILVDASVALHSSWTFISPVDDEIASIHREAARANHAS